MGTLETTNACCMNVWIHYYDRLKTGPHLTAPPIKLKSLFPHPLNLGIL